MPGVFFAGNFLSKSTGVMGVGEELASHFTKSRWRVITASKHLGRVKRMLDFLWTAYHYRKEYDVVSVEVYSYLAFRWAELLCFLLRTLRKPYILTLHGGQLPEFARKHSHRFERLIKSANRVTTPSKYLHLTFQKYRPDIIFLPNGINFNQANHRVRSHAEPKLVWLRAFHYIYNPLMAAQVFHRIVTLYPNAKMLMLGPDKNDGSFDIVKSYCVANNLMDKITFTGSVPKNEVGLFLSRGDIFLNTTNYESFGVSVMEAAACGLCIVTTDAGELPYLWDDGVNALIVPKADAAAMSEAVLRILTEPGLSEKLSINSCRKAEEYDWSKIIPLWEKLLDQVTNNQVSISNHL